MKEVILIATIILSSLSLMSQDSEKLLVDIGVSYSPIIVFSPEVGIMRESYTPNLDINFGVKGFYIFASLGPVTEFGFKSSNDFLIAGLSYCYNPYINEDSAHWVSFEFGYHTREFLNRFTLEITAKHGFVVNTGLFFFSPFNIGLKYKLVK